MGAEESTLAGAEANLVDAKHHRKRGKVSQRREHCAEFSTCIAELNRTSCASTPPPARTKPDDCHGSRGSGSSKYSGGSCVSVAVRKRPLFKHELAKDDFDVVCCTSNSVWLHRTLMRADLKHMVCESMEFAFDGGVFGESDSTATVFGAVCPLVVAAAKTPGSVSTVICFGQTGSGKTYTTNGISELAAETLFSHLPPASSVGVICVEVTGAKVCSLLSDDGGDNVAILEDGDGKVHAKGAVEVLAADAVALRQLLAKAQETRKSAATGVHDASSRSHSLCRIVVRGCDGEARGRLDLVDLAGSEWAADREQHTAARQREAAQINSSLMTLKACLRTAAEHNANDSVARLPYRDHALTKLLKDAFVGRTSRTLLLATISPSSADTEHTMSTLSHVAGILPRSACTSMSGQAADILHSHASSVACQLISTNVVLASELSRADNSQVPSTGFESKNRDESDWQDKNPIDWSSADVAMWWVSANGRAVAAINADIKNRSAVPGLAGNEPEGEDELMIVELAAEIAAGPLGITFVRATPQTKALLPVVNNLKPDSIFASVCQTDLKGWRLVQAATTAPIDGYSISMRPRDEVLTELKSQAKMRPLFLVFRPPLQPTQSRGLIVSPPPVPRIFTGKSRLGEADGCYLCERFHHQRFVVECGDTRLGKLLYDELHSIIAASGGPYTVGINGSAARGGDGGERARKKAEEHAAAEAAKWGR